MNKYSITDSTTARDTIYKYDRITKAAAKKAYNAGANIALCANKMRPGGMWHPEFTINANNSTEPADFDIICNNFRWYNCTAATGYYIAFYIVSEIAKNN